MSYIIDPPTIKMEYKPGDIIHTLNKPDLLYEIVKYYTIKQGEYTQGYYYEDVAILKPYVAPLPTESAPCWYRAFSKKPTQPVVSGFAFDKPAVLQYWDDSKSPPWICFVTQKWYLAEIEKKRINTRPKRWYDFSSFFLRNYSNQKSECQTITNNLTHSWSTDLYY